MKLTREHIIWAYRLFLGREPESEEVIAAKLRAFPFVSELRRDLVASAEFRSQVENIEPFDATNIVIKELREGLRLYIDLADYHTGINIINGLYEPDEQEFARASVKEGDSVIDIGANIGLFTILMAATVGERGHVHAFEPLPRNAALLELSITENRFSGRVTLERAAVGENAGEINLISPITTNHWGTAYLRTTGEPVPADHEATAVQIVSLDACPLRRPIRFIKMDCEGAEMLAVRGARTLLREDRPTVLSELNRPQLAGVSRCSPADFIGEMSSNGYRCSRLAPGGMQHAIETHDSDEIINVIFAPL